MAKSFFAFIEGFYDSRRLHSSLDCCAPTARERVARSGYPARSEPHRSTPRNVIIQASDANHSAFLGGGMVLTLVLGLTGCPPAPKTSPESEHSDDAGVSTTESGEETGRETGEREDADGDGVSAAEGDCADEDPERSPLASEGCADGLDNDCDAFLDCEDSDCEGSGACEELDCADGLDGDDDGWMDCADEDCWGTGDCAITASARVLGGSLKAVEEERCDRGWGVTFAGSDACDREYGYNAACADDDAAYANDVFGTVRLDWGSGAQTCTWSVRRASLRHVVKRKIVTDWAFDGTSCQPVGTLTFTSSYGSSERSGFDVSEGCPARSSWFLPRDLQELRAWRWGTVGGGVWYTGSATLAGSDTYGDEGSRNSWQVDSLAPGATYTCDGTGG